MAVTLDRLSESFFKDPPIELKVGQQEKTFYVHPQAFMPFSSSAIYARVYGSWKDKAQEPLDLTEFDEHTIVCFLSYVYARDYSPLPTAPESNLEVEEPMKKDNFKTSAPSDGQPDGEESNSGHESVDGIYARPLTPIEDFVVSERPVTLESTTDKQDRIGDQVEILATEVLTHAKVYCFAHLYLLAELEAFALNRLASSIAKLQEKQVSMSPQLMEAIQLVYSKTPDSPPNDARNLLSQYVAIKFTTILGDRLGILMSEGGSFAVEVSYKLGRRLSSNTPEDEIEQLLTKLSVLETECSELKIDLDQSREEVKGWENWNQSLPSTKRRWRRRRLDV